MAAFGPRIPCKLKVCHRCTGKFCRLSPCSLSSAPPMSGRRRLPRPPRNPPETASRLTAQSAHPQRLRRLLSPPISASYLFACLASFPESMPFPTVHSTLPLDCLLPKAALLLRSTIHIEVSPHRMRALRY